MDTLMSVLFVSAILALGLGRPQEQGEVTNEEPKCPPIPSLPIQAEGSDKTISIENTVSSCTCDLDNGVKGKYEDDTECLTVEEGYDGEPTAKRGKCKNGVCIYIPINKGCMNTPENAKSFQAADATQTKIGCAFTCSNDKGEKEYNYVKVGTKCAHKEGSTYIETTCKRYGQRILCRKERDPTMMC